MKAVMKYPGSKWSIADWIRQMKLEDFGVRKEIRNKMEMEGI